MRVRHLLLVSICCTPLAAQAQGTLNLGFEQAGRFIPGQPAGWTPGTRGPLATRRDTAVAHSGTASLQIHRDTAGDAMTGRYLPVEMLRGHKVGVSAWIKTAAVANGFAAIWLNVPGPRSMLHADQALGGRFTGDHDWTRITTSFDIDTAATQVALGFHLAGTGTAWLDDIELTVDGKPFDGVPPSTWSLSDAERAWAKQTLLRFETTTPRDNVSDLALLTRIIGDAQIIGLGEATHGTEEFVTMKQRILQLAATRGGTVIYALEAGMPFVRRVNEFVAGRGPEDRRLDPALLELMEWARQYNASGRGRIELWGFDLGGLKEPIDSVRAFVTRTEPSYLPAVDSAYAVAATLTQGRRQGADQLEAGALRVMQHLQDGKAQLLAGRDSMEVGWAIQYANLIVQIAHQMARGFDMGGRDSLMAANIAWIRTHHADGALIIASAHNDHIGRYPSAMGSYLSSMFGDSYRPFALLFDSGDYRAAGPLGFTSYGAEAEHAGSFEKALHSLGVPLFALDIRSAQSQQNAKWLGDVHELRNIGAFAMEEAFFKRFLWPAFDALVYIDATTPMRTAPR